MSESSITTEVTTPASPSAPASTPTPEVITIAARASAGGARQNGAPSAPAHRRQSPSARLRVAAYARVSTLHDDQCQSYEAQVEYYTRLIAAHADWDSAGIYTDEGVTGTSVTHRRGFCQMISTAMEGSIDLIITKSISRFARNTVDSLNYIRRLSAAGCEIWFEKENIHTFDGKGELLITIMSSLAQEESRSISDNVSWGIRESMRRGRAYVPYKHFLGYDRAPDGSMVINTEQAETVRFIFHSFLAGKSEYQIATELMDRGIPAPAGGKTWYYSVIDSILRNEKYRGDALRQKTYTRDFLSKEKITNHGEVEQYYIRNHHEAIIDGETFDRVQEELARRICKKTFRKNTKGY